MQMDPGEIAREYRRAADQKKQIKILAELNQCSDVAIIKILKEQKEFPLEGGMGKRKTAGKAGSSEGVHAITKQITDPEDGSEVKGAEPVIPESLKRLVLERMDEILNECNRITEEYKNLTSEMMELEGWMENNDLGFRRNNL